MTNCLQEKNWRNYLSDCTMYGIKWLFIDIKDLMLDLKCSHITNKDYVHLEFQLREF